MSRFSSLVRRATMKVLRVPKTRSDISPVLNNVRWYLRPSEMVGSCRGSHTPFTTQNLLRHTISTQEVFGALELLNQALKF